MNLMTHFRKITILRFVLAGPVLLFSVSALFGQGIASRYPNDVGIENDPDVILADGFESYTSPAQLLGKWDQASGALRIATEPGNYVGGHKSLEMKIPIGTGAGGGSTLKKINPKEPVLFVRVYTKFDPGFTISGSQHNGITLSGRYPGPGSPPPSDGTGFFLFHVQNRKDSNTRTGTMQPGYTFVYSYWPFQRGDYGDKWFPDGWIIAGGWGPWVTQPANYPDWRPIPNWQPIRGVWYCYEFMVKVNTLGKRDGIVAYWINGQLKGRFPDLFIRSVNDLQIDTVKLLLGGQRSGRENKKWYDNVVIARSYIGPINPHKPISMAAVADFNSNGSPDYVLQNTSTRQTAIWYLNNNVFVSAASGPTLPAGWRVIAAADFNRDGRRDYALFNASTRQTAIWYLSGVNGVTFIGSAAGPTPPAGWALVATGDFNRDGKPDYVLYNPSTRQTVIWYLNNNVRIASAVGPTLPGGWTVVGVADFNRDGKRDYLLFNPSTRRTLIWYLNNNVRISGAYGPTLPGGWAVVGVADFNRDGKSDYLLFNPSTRRTLIWYLNNNVRISGAYGPTLP